MVQFPSLAWESNSFLPFMSLALQINCTITFSYGLGQPQRHISSSPDHKCAELHRHREVQCLIKLELYSFRCLPGKKFSLGGVWELFAMQCNEEDRPELVASHCLPSTTHLSLLISPCTALSSYFSRLSLEGFVDCGQHGLEHIVDPM